MHIVAVDDNDRETEATRHFLSHLFFRSDLLNALGMDSLTWVVMEAQKPHLIPGHFGDVDILAGNLEFKDPNQFVAELRGAEQKWSGMQEAALQDYACKGVTEADGLKWPPVSSRVVAVEVKCSYFTQSDGPQSEKDSPKKVKKLRCRMDLLLKMGLDQVALLDVIGNDPTEGPGAFIEAAGRAYDSLKAFQPIIEARLPNDTTAAQFCWPVGSVFGGDEGMRGTGGLRQIRPGLQNPLVAAGDETTMRNRATLIESVSQLLASIPAPRYCPVFFIDCRKCERLHFLDDSTCLWRPKQKAVPDPSRSR